MAYTKNPYLPKVRARAIRMVKSGKGIRLTSRYFGVNASTVSRWLKRSLAVGTEELPTIVSRPQHPKKIRLEIVERVLALRPENTYDVIIKKLAGEGVKISLSSVKRIVKNS